MPPAAHDNLKSRIKRWIDDAPAWAAFVQPSRRDIVTVTLLAFALVPVGSLANHLPGIGLSLVSSGALLAFGMVLGVALVTGLLFIGLGKHGYAPASALLAFIAFDFNFPAIDAVAAAIMAFALARWKGVIVLRALWVIYAVVLVSALFSHAGDRDFLERSGQAAVANEDLPPLIHVVLDEVGPDVEMPTADYAQWTNAYSRYHVTRRSLPDLLDSFHDRLVKRGYALETWTSGYYDICRSDARCVNYWHDNIDGAIDNQTNTATVARLAIYSWFRSGALLRNITNDFDRRVQASHFNPANSMRAIELFAERAQRIGPGNAITLHALLPHYPYAFDAGCTLRSSEKWVSRDTAFSLAEREHAYAAQLKCVEKKLRAIHRDDAVIVVHGDHGTRYFDISGGRDGRSARGEQMRQAFATAFGYYLPGGSGQTISKRASISSLLDELASGEFGTIPAGRPDSVWLGDRQVREAEMIFR